MEDGLLGENGLTAVRISVVLVHIQGQDHAQVPNQATAVLNVLETAPRLKTVPQQTVQVSM